MSKPKRVRLSRAKGWRMPPNTVVVSRPTPWGNPFKVGVEGTSEHCVQLYRYLLAGLICVSGKATYDEQLAAMQHAERNLPKLRGKHLACWCALDKACHADILLKLANIKPAGGRKEEE